jgi:hypothetical protein
MRCSLRVQSRLKAKPVPNGVFDFGKFRSRKLVQLLEDLDLGDSDDVLAVESAFVEERFQDFNLETRTPGTRRVSDEGDDRSILIEKCDAENDSWPGLRGKPRSTTQTSPRSGFPIGRLSGVEFQEGQLGEMNQLFILFRKRSCREISSWSQSIHFLGSLQNFGEGFSTLRFRQAI